MSSLKDQDKFWLNKSLEQMSPGEWESLCDGCGKCCLHKLEDEDSEEIAYTRVICRYFDESSCRCKVYSTRKALVPACVILKPTNLKDLPWMPSTCAYRLLYEGKNLPDWHPLISGDRQAIAESGNTVSGKVISEEFVHENGYDEHLVQWVD
ncbi:MAG: YcgN family cysteine cluster protein [Gammaproteobacteria bacterium]|nr:YcgN family cysteine cluster protein [Gammaproteobacteria bacterium]